MADGLAQIRYLHTKISVARCSSHLHALWFRARNRYTCIQDRHRKSAPSHGVIQTDSDVALHASTMQLPKKMYVDCDEYFVPAFGDVASARQMNNFNYHMVMIKPHAGKRNWSRSLEWVDQPYYYRFLAFSPSGTKFNKDVILTTMAMNR